MERFIKPINELATSLADSKSVNESIDILIKTNGRAVLFHMEGLLKIYSKIYPDDLKLWKVKIKSIEDALGHHIEKLEYLEDAKKLKNIPKEILAVLEEPIAPTRELLRKTLKDDKWLTKDGQLGPAWAKFVKDLKEQDWSNKEEDGDLFAEVVIDKMKEVRDDLDNGEYSPYQLQTGVHELRRHLRWFLIYFQAGNGLFKLINPSVDMDLPEYLYLLKEPIAKSKYSKLPTNPRIEDPYTLPFHYFLALSAKVVELGNIKSHGELFEVLVESFVQSGLSKTKASARQKVSTLFKSNSLPVTYSSQAKRLIDEMVDSEMLRIIRKWLKIQLQGGDPLED